MSCGQPTSSGHSMLRSCAVNRSIRHHPDGLHPEYRAEQALAALTSMTAPHARVVCDGTAQFVEIGGIVAGDLVLLAPNAGQRLDRGGLGGVGGDYGDGAGRGVGDGPAQLSKCRGYDGDDDRVDLDDDRVDLDAAGEEFHATGEGFAVHARAGVDRLVGEAPRGSSAASACWV
jgi:hypothetical protein